MKRILILLIVLFCALTAQAQDQGIRPYQKGEWSSLLKANAGKPLVVHFWGVTCAPCAKEMPEWGKFLSQNKGANIVFIQVDDVPIEMVKKMLSKANLDRAENFNSTSPFDEYLRYEVDPKWRGETPVTFLIAKNGKTIKKTGPVNFDQLKDWFKANS